MNYLDEVKAMREYIVKYEEVEEFRDTFANMHKYWYEMDEIMTAYMEMWGQRYDRLLNAPEWLWKDK